MKVIIQNRSVMEKAFKDISRYLNSKGKIPNGFGNDIWQSTPSRMNNKKTRQLNNLLGVNKINYYNNNLKTK